MTNEILEPSNQPEMDYKAAYNQAVQYNQSLANENINLRKVVKVLSGLL